MANDIEQLESDIQTALTDDTETWERRLIEMLRDVMGEAMRAEWESPTMKVSVYKVGRMLRADVTQWKHTPVEYAPDVRK